MIKRLKSIPWYGYVLGVGLFAFQFLLYWLAHQISISLNLTPFSPKIDTIDNLIPVLPVFVIPYLYSYLFWICGPIAVSICDKKHFINFITSMIIGCLIGFVIFAFVPSYMDRQVENLYQGLGTDIFSQLLRVVYDGDGQGLAYNLFPSFHCMISVFCYLGVRKRQEISPIYRYYSLILAILICFSTVFTKQHYFLDVVSGVSIAIICFVVVKFFDLGNRIFKTKK